MTVTEQASATDNEITPQDFDFLRTLLLRVSAIEISPGQEYLVDSRLAPVARQHELDGIAGVIRTLRAGLKPEIQKDVIDAMTTNETSFFRDQHPFKDLVDHVIPDLLAGKVATDPLVIWSAACSSGQEPYTLAIVLNEHFPELIRQGRIRIVATDLSATMVNRCTEGRYSQFEVNRGLPAPHLLTYFEQDGREWVASRELAKMIEASELNFLDPWPDIPRCDLVLLRNVLIYFPIETKQMILDRVRSNVLRPTGYLLLGSSETTLNTGGGFEAERFDRATFYRPQPQGT